MTASYCKFRISVWEGSKMSLLICLTNMFLIVGTIWDISTWVIKLILIRREISFSELRKNWFRFIMRNRIYLWLSLFKHKISTLCHRNWWRKLNNQMVGLSWSWFLLILLMKSLHFTSSLTRSTLSSSTSTKSKVLVELIFWSFTKVKGRGLLRLSYRREGWRDLRIESILVWKRWKT